MATSNRAFVIGTLGVLTFTLGMAAACGGGTDTPSSSSSSSSTSSGSSSSSSGGTSEAGTNPACPGKPPTNGSACSTDGLKCNYVYCDEGGPADATCSGGAWSVFAGTGPCTQRPDASAGCANGGAPCTGTLVCCSGVPYPDEGICQAECNQKSDRNAKERFEAVDGDELLSKLSRVPITRWSYKEQPDVRHIGPMAQDFRMAFDVGGDARVINGVDGNGVALVAIQTLDRHVRALESEVAALREKNATLEEKCERPRR